METLENLNDVAWENEVKEVQEEINTIGKKITLLVRKHPEIGMSGDIEFSSLTNCILEFFNSHADLWRYYSDYDPERAKAYRVNLLVNLKKQVLELNKLLKILDSILASLVSKHSADPVTNFNKFIENNKLPAPADEELKRKRLPISIAQELAITLDLTDKEMANILTISIRTYHRLKLNGLLNPVASERLLLLKDIAEFGLEVFEDQDNFNKWLRLPIRDLSDNSPLDSLDTATGFNHVKTVLERIEYGVYS